MKRRFAKRQQGMALLALLAAILLAGSWMLVSRLNAESAVMTAVNRTRNAEVLNRAKQAMIGYVAMQAAESGERNPGRLPCPEGASYVGDAANEGVAWSGVGTDCTSVGRLPWRTLGLDKLRDASSEPLWYVVGPTWRLTSSTDNLTINSNTNGNISIDAQNAVALIIAPGPAMNAQAAAGCTAKNQARSAPSPSIDATNYLECFDAATLQFTTTASSNSYNDQVVRITVADIMPAIEAAIADRIKREIVPQLKSAYGTATWSLSSTNPLFPDPAPFSIPNPGTSNFQGASGTSGGLLPVNSQACSGDPRCATIVSWWKPVVASVAQIGGAGSLQVGTTCVLRAGDTQVRCQGSYLALGPVQLTMSARANKVALGLRALNASQITARYDIGGSGCGGTSVAVSASGAFVSDGSADIMATATFPSSIAPPSLRFCITVDIDVLVDHPLLSSTDPTTGWFMRNEWYRLLYYAPAARHTAGGGALPAPSCTTGVNCLSVANVAPSGAQRAILILAGRSINGSARPSSTLGDYLEFGNATAAFESQPVSTATAAALKKPFNDRIVVIDQNN